MEQSVQHLKVLVWRDATCLVFGLFVTSEPLSHCHEHTAPTLTLAFVNVRLVIAAPRDARPATNNTERVPFLIISSLRRTLDSTVSFFRNPPTCTPHMQAPRMGGH